MIDTKTKLFLFREVYACFLNNKNEIIDMPGPKKTLNLYKPSVMVSKDTGTFFIQIMNIIDANNDGGVTNQLTIRMADTAEGCNPLKGEGAEYTYPWTSKKLDGKLHIWNGKETKSFDVAQSGFGSSWTNEPKRIVLAEPRAACNDKGFSVNVQNSIVVF